MTSVTSSSQVRGRKRSGSAQDTDTNSTRPTRADDVYRRLRAEILDLNLSPGDQLDEDQLAQSFGVSRTPVREALRRLAADNLVTSRPHRGTYVAEISAREMWEIEQICELLEPAAARIAAGRVPEEVLDTISAALDASDIDFPTREDVIRYMKLDVHLHEAILQAAGNTTMRDMITHLHRRMNAVRIVVNIHRFTESIEEHRRIIAALRAGDGEAAGEAMHFHIRQRARRQWSGLTDPSTVTQDSRRVPLVEPEKPTP